MSTMSTRCVYLLHVDALTHLLPQASSNSDEQHQQQQQGQHEGPDQHQQSNKPMHTAGSWGSLHSHQIRPLELAQSDDSAVVAETVAGQQHSRNMSIYSASDHSGEICVATADSTRITVHMHRDGPCIATM
jgi:hypothetical protein